MKFYSHEDEPFRRNRVKTPLRLIAVAGVSALAGSLSTFALVPVLQSHGVIPTTSPVAATEAAAAGNIPTLSTSVTLNVSDGITQAVKQAQPAVMGVVNYGRVSDFFSQNTKLRATGVGTGVLLYKDDNNGFAVTNNHVVDGAAKVEVVLGSSKHVPAKVVGTDPYTDLAILRIPLASVKSIPVVKLANSDNLQPGEPAIAIGTPMGLDFADSVTAGIVSAKKRLMPVEDPQSQQTLDYQAVIQTDAAINPGNSGGPLLNIHGEVIGINSSKIVAQNFEGMGFAIPSNEVRTIADQIMKTGHALHPAIGIKGLSLSMVPEQYWPDAPVDYGIWVQGTTSKDTAALRAQDVIVGIDSHTVKNMADLRTYLFQKRPGQTVTLRVYRGSKEMNVQVKLGEMQSLNTADASPTTQDNGDGSDPFALPNLFGN